MSPQNVFFMIIETNEYKWIFIMEKEELWQKFTIWTF